MRSESIFLNFTLSGSGFPVPFKFSNSPFAIASTIRSSTKRSIAFWKEILTQTSFGLHFSASLFYALESAFFFRMMGLGSPPPQGVREHILEG